MKIERKRELMAREITINGERAVITGIHEQFPRVESLRGAISAEFAWPTIERVITNSNGAFKA
jgi:hypothetical protein